MTPYDLEEQRRRIDRFYEQNGLPDAKDTLILESLRLLLQHAADIEAAQNMKRFHDAGNGEIR